MLQTEICIVPEPELLKPVLCYDTGRERLHLFFVRRGSTFLLSSDGKELPVSIDNQKFIVKKKKEGKYLVVDYLV